jgi:hypothetical protein
MCAESQAVALKGKRSGVVSKREASAFEGIDQDERGRKRPRKSSGGSSSVLWIVLASVGGGELLAIVWSEPRFSQCLARLPCFAYAGQRTADGKGWVKFVDERELPFLVFSRDEKGFDDYFAPAEVVPDIHGIAGESEVNILIPIDA